MILDVTEVNVSFDAPPALSTDPRSCTIADANSLVALENSILFLANMPLDILSTTAAVMDYINRPSFMKTVKHSYDAAIESGDVRFTNLWVFELVQRRAAQRSALILYSAVSLLSNVMRRVFRLTQNVMRAKSQLTCTRNV